MALNGPQHYSEAEGLLKSAQHEENATKRANILAEAQVHATLALVSATVHPAGSDEKMRRWETYGVMG